MIDWLIGWLVDWLVDWLVRYKLSEVILKEKNSTTVLKKPGRKPEVKLEQVIAAAERLIQENRYITGWTLRDVIGSGGPNYLIKIWEQHQLDNGMTNDEAEVQSDVYILPPELDGKINILLADVSQQINNFAVESDALANQVAAKKERAAYDTMISTNKRLVEEQDLANRIIVDSDAELQLIKEHIQTLEQQTVYQSKLYSELQAKLEKVEDAHIQTKSLLVTAQKCLDDESKKRVNTEKSEIKLNTKLEVALIDKIDAIKELKKTQEKLTEMITKFSIHEEVIAEKNKLIAYLETEIGYRNNADNNSL
ncbi:MAG: hypothetical protein ACJAUY_001632 [Cognaticolwellia sp.]